MQKHNIQPTQINADLDFKLWFRVSTFNWKKKKKKEKTEPLLLFAVLLLSFIEQNCILGILWMKYERNK